MVFVFDPNRPNNDLPFLPPTMDFRDPELLIELNRANIELGKLNEEFAKIPNQQLLLEFVSIKEWVNSNEVENINTTISDAFIAELVPSGTDIKKGDKETIRYKEAVRHGYAMFRKNGFLATNDYVKLNNILLKNEAGIVTSPDKRIKNGETVRYTPPQGLDIIGKLLKNFEDYYNTFDEEIEIDPLLKMGILHYQFEAIHPFGDGNGRVGRILSVLYLVLTGKLKMPTLFLSEFILAHRDEYYALLAAADKRETGAWKSLTLWSLKWIQLQAKDTTITILDIRLLMEKTKSGLKTSPLLSKIYSKNLMDFLFARPYYDIRSYEKTLGVHRNTATTHLKLLQEQWVLDSIKIGNRIFYYFKDFLKILDPKTFTRGSRSV